MNVHVILPSPRNDTNIMETKPLRSRWQLCCRMKTKTKTKASMLGITHHEWDAARLHAAKFSSTNRRTVYAVMRGDSPALSL